ncbi:MAG: adenine phosphoribosyltransferase [Desulfobulbaceae bacterium]|jgi:adenine phosphoribosyltransferase|nr:adenine phosphoribosyltransferase [Desulfobulbaceae bacterium]
MDGPFNPSEHIRLLMDWPKEGVIFRDITPLLTKAVNFRQLVDLFTQRHLATKIDAVAAIDARGFIIGAPVAYALGVAFVPIRKKGKLPGAVISQSYTLEYGEAELEIQTDCFSSGARLLLIDDLIATGGTLVAAIGLLKRLEAKIVEVNAIVDLPDLGGSARLRQQGITVHTFCSFVGA